MLRAIIFIVVFIPSALLSQNHSQYKNKTAEQLSGLRRGQSKIDWDTFINNFFGPLNSAIQRQFKEGYIVGYDYPDFESTVSAIGSSNGIVVVVDSQAVSQVSQYTVPSNVSVVVRDGGFLYVGKKFTINGKFYAGLAQCFKGNIDSVEFASGSVDYVRPEWFAGLPDVYADGATKPSPGATDFTNALRVCVKQSGMRILFGTGTYVVSDSIAIKVYDSSVDSGTTGLILDGQGERKTRIFLADGSNSNVFVLEGVNSDPAKNYIDVVFRGLFIHGNAAGQTGNYSNIVVRGARRVFIQNCRIDGASDAGIWITDGPNGSPGGSVRIKDNFLVGNANYGIRLGTSGASSIVASDNIVSDNDIGWSRYGIYIDKGASPNFIQGNLIGECDWGIYLDYGGAYIIGGRLQNIDSVGVRLVSDTFLIGTHVQNVGLAADGTVYDVGVLVDATTRRAHVIGNEFQNCYFGIRVESGADSVAIMSNSYYKDVTDPVELVGSMTNYTVHDGWSVLTSGAVVPDTLVISSYAPPSPRDGTTYWKQGAVGAPDTLLVFINGKWQKWVGIINN